MNLKRLLTLLLIFSLILIVIPQTFASDMANNESDIIQLSDADDVLSSDYWYQSQPSEDCASINYDGGSKDMKFTADIDPYWSTPGEGRYFGGISLYVYVNGNEDKRVMLSGYNGASKDIEFDLNIVKNQLVDGKNEITVHPDETQMKNMWCTQYNFVPGEVYYYASTYDYRTTVYPSNVKYTIGTDREISVTTEFNADYNESLKDIPMYVWINEETQIKLNNTMANSANFTVDLKNITDGLGIGKYNISFHPQISSLKSINPNIRYIFNNLTLELVNPIYDYYVSTPDPCEIEEYIRNTDENITVSTEYWKGLDDVMGWFTMCVYIDDIEGYNWDFIRGVLANDTQFTFNLKDISSQLNDGKNKLYFAPYTREFFNVFEGNNYTFNPLVVNVKKTATANDYVSTPTPSYVDYIKGNSEIISVNITYPNTVDLSESAMFVYINGEDTDNRVKIEGVDSGETYFTFDLANISDKLVEGENKLTFHPNTGMLEHYIYGDLIFNNLTVMASSDLFNTSITVNPTSLKLNVGKNATVKAVLTPSNAGNITFTSSDENIVKVSENGIITTVAEGEANITVSFAGNEKFKASQAIVSIIVTNEKLPYYGVIYVAKDGSDENEGSEYQPVLTIEKAIELAASENNTEHKIVVREGVYEESDLAIDSDLEIVGENAIIDASGNGKILNITAGNVKISGVTFANANVVGYGGAVDIQDATVEIDGCTFVNNTAASGAGAILWNADNGKLSNSIFENNSGRNGGAVTIGSLSWSPKGDNTEISNCIFDGNNNLYEAAGCTALVIYADDVKVTDSNFTNNHGEANSDHGALYVLGDNAEISGCLFENNSMDGAGALQADGDYVNIHDNIFKNNTITGGIASRAGAIEIQSINADITNNVFIDNGGDDCREGGAINIVYVDYDGEITISGNQFINNSAAYGGAIYVDGGYSDTMGEFTLVISDNTFDGNVAGQGAGIYTYNTGYAEVTISDNTFKNQQATEGGAIYSEDSLIALSQNIMENCIAENGCGIYLNYGEITTETTLDISKDTKIKLGQNVTVKAILTDDNNNTVSGGVITLTSNEEVLCELDVVNGTVSFVFVPENTGNYTISGSFDLASDITVKTATVEVIDNKVDPNLSADSNNTHIIVNLAEDATGNVTVSINGIDYNASIVNGIATVEIPELESGIYTANITYSGDKNYYNATTSVDFVVSNPEKENATITVENVEIFEGENATITVTLPEDAKGNVTIGNVIVPVINGTAAADISGLSAGNYTVRVIYSGDDKYNPSISNATVTVSPKVTPKTNLTIEATADAITVGDDAVINVNGLENATGNVTASINGETYTGAIENGTATIVVSGLVENVTAVVSYAGDDNYNNASATVDIVVNSKIVPKQNATMDVDAPEVTEGENATITVTLPDDAAGNVTATVENVTYAAPVENGTATIIIPDLDAGNYTIPIAYSGDDKYNANETTVDVIVDEDSSIDVSAPDVEKYFSGAERFVVKVTDGKGNPVANKTAVITINGVSYTRTTNANGTTSIPLGLPAGVYNVTAVVDNQTVSSVATILTTVNGTDITKVFRNATQYYATFRDSEGNYLAEGSEVEFNINGVFYTRTVKENGLAKLNINLEQGEYIITANNTKTGELSSNTITVIPRIIENRDLTKYYRNASQYTVKIIGDDGKAVGAGEEVTFNINGVFYTRTTNASGIAKLNINLEAGDYIITAEYAGCRVSNNISVLPILSANDLTKTYGTSNQFVATLVNGQGNPLEDARVTFNINGVFYYRYTDSAGNAKLNINLQPGEYIITSSYNGCNIANTVKVNA